MFPLEFLQRLELINKNESEKIVGAITQKKTTYAFRLNAQKLSLSELTTFIKDETLKEVSFIKNAFTTQKKELYTKNPLFFAGCYYFQDLSSMIPVQVLNPQTDSKVLDSCASPGSKSTQITNYLGFNGLLVANEITRTRVARLIENIATWGTAKVIVSSQETQAFSHLNGFFDKVLVDAPCSGEGMFSKNEEAINGWSVKLIKKCSALQKEILTNILPSILAGGELVYSTCTMAPEENEEIIEWLITTYKDYLELVPFTDEFNLGSKGLGEFNGKKYAKNITELTRRIFPHNPDFLGEAFFVAKIRVLKEIPSEKNGEGAKNMRYKNYSETPHKLIDTFLKELNLQNFINPKDLILLGYHLYYKKEIGEPILKKLIPLLHPVYCGVRVGTVKKERIEPCSECVTSLPYLFSEDKNNYIDLPLKDCVNYMQGLQISLSNNENEKNGFKAVGCYFKPLGTGKYMQSMLKSYFNTEQGKKLL